MNSEEGISTFIDHKYADKELSNLDIKDILEYGVDLASVVIQQPGGLLDPKLVACMR